MKGADSDLGHALLALLHQQPRSGYDLRKIFESSPIAHYSDSPGAIYPALRRLRQRGLVQAAPEPVPSGRRRQAFRPTAAGRRTFRAWLTRPVGRDDVERDLDGLVLRFAFMSEHLDGPAIAAFLASLAAALREHLAGLARFHRARASALTQTGRLAFESGVLSLRATLRWTEHARREVRRSRSGRKERA
jgi:DNA-binding PadR family transcriptional regulator